MGIQNATANLAQVQVRQQTKAEKHEAKDTYILEFPQGYWPL
jgi:hypothetical protein